MPYEPGSNECHALIEAKRSVESALVEIGKIKGTNNLREKLIDIHLELEAIHEDFRINNVTEFDSCGPLSQ